MGTELAKIEPLPVPAPTNPTPSWPTWLTTLGKCVVMREMLIDPLTVKYGDVPTLETLPTDSQRLSMEGHRNQLTALLDQVPLNSEVLHKQMFGLVAKLMLAKPSRAGGPETADARIEAYLLALDDTPVWAVATAIRKWHRGECDDYRSGAEKFDYRWAPEFADLRKLALREAGEVRRRIMLIDRILSAVLYQERTGDRPLPQSVVQYLSRRPRQLPKHGHYQDQHQT